MTRTAKWGVFRFEPENMYLGKNAIGRYVSRSRAERTADALTSSNAAAVPRGYVVREITREGAP